MTYIYICNRANKTLGAMQQGYGLPSGAAGSEPGYHHGGALHNGVVQQQPQHQPPPTVTDTR